MTDPRKTRIVALLDRTGSMQPIRRDTEGAFDAFIEQQRGLTDELADICEVTLWQFDAVGYNIARRLRFGTGGYVTQPPRDDLQLVYRAKPLAEVPPLSLVPRGGTPLHDCFARAINETGEELRLMPDPERPGKVVFVVMTDGDDNQSVEHTVESVRALVTEQTDKWSWEFVFIGVGIDGWAAGTAYGVPGYNTVSVAATGDGVREAYAGTQSIVTRVRAGK